MESRTIRWSAILSVGVVALVAAIVSYVHMHDLAAASGEAWLSWLEPLSVDGLLIGSSLVLLRRGARQWLAWLAVTTGLLASLAANLAVAGDGLVPHLVAGWPAVALALSYETLLTLLRPPLASRRQAGEQAAPAEHQPLARLTLVDATSPGDDLEDGPASVDVSDAPAAVTGPVHGPEQALLDQARQAVHQARLVGDAIGRIRLAHLLDVTEHQARQLLAEVNREHPAA